MTAPERTWETSRLLAKPAAVADAQVVFDDYASDPAVAKYMTWTPHRSVADTKEFLSRCERVWIEGSAFPWSLWYKQDGAFVDVRPVVSRKPIGILREYRPPQTPKGAQQGDAPKTATNSKAGKAGAEHDDA